MSIEELAELGIIVDEPLPSLDDLDAEIELNFNEEN